MARKSSSRSFPVKKESRRVVDKNISQEEKLSTRSRQEYGGHCKEVEPLNYIQGEYLEAIKYNEVTFGIGPAGTGKTWVAAGYAAGELFHRRVDKIILIRPNIEVGRGLGYLPGSEEEKLAPFYAVFDSVFTKFLGKGFYEYAKKNEDIELVAIAYARGVTFDNCIVLLDEAQDCTREEMKMILSRIGKNCKMIISGDHEQVDIPDSGLEDAVNRLEGIDGIEVIEFLDSDIVRSKMCKQIIMAYRK